MKEIKYLQKLNSYEFYLFFTYKVPNSVDLKLILLGKSLLLFVN